MYIISNAAPAFTDEGKLNVYGGLAVAVMDSIPEEGATWAGFVTDPSDNSEVYDASTKINRLPIQPSDMEAYKAHYSRWCKGIVYAAFHDLMEYAGLESETYARPQAEEEALYEAHIQTVDDLAASLATKIKNKERFGAPKQPIMVHDYQLLMIAKSLKEQGMDDRDIGYYLHIPFPSPQNFMQIPNAPEILDGMLAYDMIGFQDSRHSLRNFLALIQEIHPHASYDENSKTLEVGNRKITIEVLPASINPHNVAKEAVEMEGHDAAVPIIEQANGRKIIFSVQRFDIIKGIPEGLSAIEKLLDANPAMAQEVYFAFCCQPTRYEGVDCYNDYQDESMEIIARIQAKHPNTLEHIGGLPREAVLNLMRKSDVMYIPTIIEGQNLVGKEFIAAQGHEEPGVLVMTTGCGAYEGLEHTDGLFIEDARDVDEHLTHLKRAIEIANTPLALEILEQQQDAVYCWTSADYGKGLKRALSGTSNDNDRNAPATLKAVIGADEAKVGMPK